jgi:hypothetical protein
MTGWLGSSGDRSPYSPPSLSRSTTISFARFAALLRDSDFKRAAMWPPLRGRQAQERVGAMLLRVRGWERVRLPADLTVLARLACALARARAASVAA